MNSTLPPPGQIRKSKIISTFLQLIPHSFNYLKLSPIYCFDDFRFAPARLTLTRNGLTVKLTEKERLLLLALLEAGGAIVGPDALQQRLWKESLVSQGNVQNQVWRLRHALGRTPTGESYIENVRNEGYRLAVDVHTERVIRGGSLYLRQLTLSLLVLLTVASLGFAIFRTPSQSTPTISDQLTNDGFPKSGPIAVTGGRIFFAESVDGKNYLASVPQEGGEVARSAFPEVRSATIADARLPGPEFLLAGEFQDGLHHLFSAFPGSPPRALMTGHILGAAWLSVNDLAVALDGGLRLVRSGRIWRSVDLPGQVQSLSWNATRQRLRLAVWDAGGNHTTLWEMRGPNGAVEPVADYPRDSREGSWQPNGELFTFVAHKDKASDLWIARPQLAKPLDKQTRLTYGPIDYSWPVPSSDGSTVFAIGEKSRFQLTRYNASTKTFVPYLMGQSICETDFTRDRQSLTYIKYPERTLWTSNFDGSNPVQLTKPPLQAIEPHWAPDGSRIAFLGAAHDGSERIYLIPANGGHPVPATGANTNEGVPTWSPDGESIVYGDLNRSGSGSMRIHTLNLRTRKVSDLDGSSGLWNPRWSPDGKFISATTPDFKHLKLFDFATRAWHDLYSLDNITSTAWSPDSSAIYLEGENRAHDADHPNTTVIRVDIKTVRAQVVADLDSFSIKDFTWFGLTPESVPLLLRGTAIQEIFAVKVR
jgi:Tol biopolymer transport system component/DNA-binding winged helix-turn-helix (wHTH) protein